MHRDRLFRVTVLGGFALVGGIGCGAAAAEDGGTDGAAAADNAAIDVRGELAVAVADAHQEPRTAPASTDASATDRFVEEWDAGTHPADASPPIDARAPADASVEAAADGAVEAAEPWPDAAGGADACTVFFADETALCIGSCRPAGCGCVVPAGCLCVNCGDGGGDAGGD